ncbi:MAG: hypothetical protein RIS75_1332 [Actinomycetota bacterium]|jgi:predicted NBD/HSP70 family sugar kinase
MKEVSAQAVPSYLREINERRVLDALRENGTAHAAEVARFTGLSRPTAAQVLRSLIEVGLVQEQFPTEGDPRRARAMYAAVVDIGAVLAIDIGARFIRAAVGDLNGTILATVSRPMTSVNLASVLQEMHKAVHEALQSAGFTLEQVLAIVVGSPGVVDPTNGQIAIAGTISDLDGIPLGEVLAKEFNNTPIIENDVNLVTIAEQTYGSGKGVANFVVLSVGSGIGAGLTLNGSLHRGHRGAAGEIFYVPFGDPFNSVRRSTDPSGGQIEALAEELAAEYPETRLTKPYTSISIFDAARYKDPLAVAVVTNVAERIAMYIATITAVVDVELVVLSGGVGRQADVLLAEIQAFVARIVPFAPRIEVSNLGDNAVLLGGIALCTSVAQDAVFAQRSNAYQAAREVGELVR